MHGSFIVCLKEMILNKFDESFWIETLEHAGIEIGFHPVSNKEILDATGLKIIKSSIKKLNLDDRRFGEIFGNYWINNYASKNYFAFFDACKSVKEFLEHLNSVHKKITANLPNPSPPDFSIKWENPLCAIIDYNSKRDLIHLAVGLLKALGAYYREEIAVYRIEKNKIKLFLDKGTSNHI
jgi:hypothetical protein